ncbi:hypothetical protein [Sphingomonas turrisvirgatae]
MSVQHLTSTEIYENGIRNRLGGKRKGLATSGTTGALITTISAEFRKAEVHPITAIESHRPAATIWRHITTTGAIAPVEQPREFERIGIHEK